MRRFVTLALWILMPVAAGAAGAEVRRIGTAESDCAWAAWSPRQEIAPRTFRDTVRYRTGPASLAVSGNSNAAIFGGWQCGLRDIEPGAWYRFTGWYRAEGAPQESLQVVSRLDWARGDGRRAGQPDYVWQSTVENGWTGVTADVPAPRGAAAVNIQLLLQNAPAATVWWDDLSLEKIPAPGPREVKVASVNFMPAKVPSAAEAVAQSVAAAEQAAPDGVDVILLPEGITRAGTGKPHGELAEPIPGPSTEALGALARRKRAYVVAGIYEREGQAVYNTAVLIDRAGRVAGRYRKVYIPREEMEGGITPGGDYPVFRTDFGTVGIMICWDVQYPDPARALAMRGAEIILMPIWGGNETLAKARAIENHLFLAASGYSFPTCIIDPNGEVVAVAKERRRAAVGTIDLNRRYIDRWLGDMRGRFHKELRLDLRP